ncbi:protein involved in de novo 2 [Quercus suber]|uniref:Protein involved in de novo 2 n=1 Tax=Quercus suber TaxID=58331 RepID=A0AAW0JMP4_QUESU
MEEASETADEMCLDIGYDMGSMAHDDAGPSHTFAHGDISQSPSIRSDDTCPPTSPTTSPLPTGITPTDVHGRDEMRFMPTLGRPTPSAVPPKFVHTEHRYPPPHQRLHTFRIGREGRNGHRHILLIVGLDMYLLVFFSGKVRPVKEPRQKEELHKRIIQLQKQLDAKQALELEIERLRGSLNVMKHMGDDGDVEILEIVDTILKQLRDKGELEDLEALNQTLIVKERKSNDELQEA